MVVNTDDKILVLMKPLFDFNSVYFHSESAVFPAKTERRKRGPRPQVKYRGMRACSTCERI